MTDSTADQPSGGRLPRLVGSRRRRASRSAPYVFLTPYVVFLVLFGVVPVAYAAVISLTQHPSGPGGVFASYVRAATDFRFGPAIGDVGTYLVFWLPSLVVLSFVVAFLLDARPSRFATALRIIYYLPSALAGSASVVLWLFMLDPTVSPFKPLLHLLGFHTLDGTVTPGHIAAILALMGVSLGAGGWIVIIFGALQNLPEPVLEAARLDGCGQFRLIRYIKLAMVRRYAALIVILSFATGTQVFVEPQILAAANAGFVSPTWSINELAYYYAFDYGDFSVSAAISIALFVVSLSVALLVLFRTNFYSLERV